MDCGQFGELNGEEMAAVMQLTYQLIGCAKQEPVSEEDNASIDVMMRMLGFKTNMGNLIWNIAVDMNPYEAFRVISGFSSKKKEAFKGLILAVADVENTFLRMDIANQIFSNVGI